jgi:thioredoxin reductase
MQASLSASTARAGARPACPARPALASTPVVAAPASAPAARRARRAALQVAAAAVRDGAKLDRKLRVAVIGGGPSGACAAETLAAGGVETFLIERKLDNCKVCLEEEAA